MGLTGFHREQNILTREIRQGGPESPLKVSDHEFVIMPICVAYLICAEEKGPNQIHQRLKFCERSQG